MTPRETILVALHARLSALPATALRGDVLPERMPVEGLMILRDGEPGAPEVTLSPLRYHYQHRAEIEAVVQGADRDAAFDTLTASIGAALAADRTLGVLRLGRGRSPAPGRSAGRGRGESEGRRYPGRAALFHGRPAGLTQPTTGDEHGTSPRGASADGACVRDDLWNAARQRLHPHALRQHVARRGAAVAEFGASATAAIR